MRILERRRRRDRGLRTIGVWTRWALAGGMTFSGALAAGFAWTAPGHSAKATGPDSTGGAQPPSFTSPLAPGTTDPGTTAPARPKRRHTSHPAPSLRPPVRPVRPTAQPPATTSGGS